MTSLIVYPVRSSIPKSIDTLSSRFTIEAALIVDLDYLA